MQQRGTRILMAGMAASLLLAACSIEDTEVEPTTGGDAATTTQAGSTETTAAPAETTAAPAEGAASIGDTVSAGDMAFTLNGVRVSEGTDFSEPEPGEKWVVIDGTWENRGSESESVSSLLSLELRIDGRSMSFTFAGDENGSLDGDVLPGSVLSGETAFVVSVDATEAELLVSVDIFGSPAVYLIPLP